MKYYGGIDPGLRNLGLAVLDETGKTHAAGHETVQTLDDIILAVEGYMNRDQVVKVGIEAYAFFGPRKNYGPMCEVIGAIKATLIGRGIAYVMLQPRQKERAKLARPAGEPDHAYDARCLAWLTIPGNLPPNSRPGVRTRTARAKRRSPRIPRTSAATSASR
jgi:hypothetical protein